jgi:nucleoside-diphosphate-sugar epimerase
LALLLEKGYPVRAIYRTEPSKFLTEEQNKKIEWVQGDVLDIYSLESTMQNASVVFHCAAMVSFDARQRDILMETNIEGTANVVNCMLDLGVKKIVHLSSVAALGRSSGNEKIDEDADWLDGKYNSQYAASKYRSEMEVWRGVAEGLQAVIVNPGIVLGEGDWNNGSNKLFKNIYVEFPFYTKGVTSFVDVKDVVRAMVELYEMGVVNERYIISEGTHSYLDIFKLMAKGFNKKAPSREAKPWMIALVWRFYEVKKWFSSKEQTITKETARSAQSTYEYDNTKLKKALPNFQYTPIEETIERACTFYKN